MSVKPVSMLHVINKIIIDTYPLVSIKYNKIRQKYNKIRQKYHRKVRKIFLPVNVVRVINIEGHYLIIQKRAHLLRKRKSETQYKGI